MLDYLRMYLSDHVLCQFNFPLVIIDKRLWFLFRIFCNFVPHYYLWIFCSAFIFPFPFRCLPLMVVQVQASEVLRLGQGIHVPIPHFQLVTSFQEMALILSPDVLQRCRWLVGAQLFGMWGFGAIAITLWSLKKGWWNYSGCGASVCFCASAAPDTPFLRCFKEVDYEKAIGHISALTCDLAMSEITPAVQFIRFPRPLTLCKLHSNWTYWEGECDFKYCKSVYGRNAVVSWIIVEVYALQGLGNATSCLGRPSWWTGYDSYCVVMVPILPVF